MTSPEIQNQPAAGGQAASLIGESLSTPPEETLSDRLKNFLSAAVVSIALTFAKEPDLSEEQPAENTTVGGDDPNKPR